MEREHALTFLLLPKGVHGVLAILFVPPAPPWVGAIPDLHSGISWS